MKPLITIPLKRPLSTVFKIPSDNPQKNDFDTLLCWRDASLKKKRFKSKASLFLFIPLLFLTSCGIYQNSFDCPPGKGIGCAPVGKVLDLIVEQDEGEDLFATDKGTSFLLQREKEDRLPLTTCYRKRSYLIKDDAGQWRIVPLSNLKPKKEQKKCPS